jgi:hypothetical protein
MNHALEGTLRDFAMVWNWNGFGVIPLTLLHDDMATGLAHLFKTMGLQYSANVTS